MLPTHNSELISRHFPAYLMGINPDESVIAASYATPLAQRMSRDVQRIIDSDAYARVFPATKLWGKNIRSVADGSYLRNSDIFEVVNQRGVYRACGLQGSLTGMGAKFLFIDDNIKDAAQAMSQTIMDNQWEWYGSTFRTRLAKGGRIAIVATRWSFDDIIGRLLRLAEEHPNADQWRVVNLPAIKETPPTEDDPRQPGEALWPEFFPLKEMETLRATNSRQFEALYQCNPVPLGGNLIQDKWWREYQPAELPHKFDKVIVACDLTFKDKQQGDWTVLIALGLYQGRCYVLDMVRRQIAFTAQKAAILDIVERTNATHGHVREVIVEDAANGAAIVDALRVHLPNVIAVSASAASKYARASAVTPIIEAGNVLLPCPTRAAWVQTLRVEWAQFPMARHDDIVDALTHGLARLFPPRISMAGAMPVGIRKPTLAPLIR